QNAMASEQNTLAQNLGELSNAYRFQDYQTQQAMEEAALGRSLQAQMADNQINAQMADNAAGRSLQGGIAAAGLYDNALARDLQAWAQHQGNQLSALGMVPGLHQAQYLGAGLLGQQGLQQQG